jgi:hypothetical protein
VGSTNLRFSRDTDTFGRYIAKGACVCETEDAFFAKTASTGVEGWWFVVRGTGWPSLTLQRRIRVSPQWAVTIVAGDAGFQKGVGVGVEMRAIDAVEPPWKRVWLPMGLFRTLLKF